LGWRITKHGQLGVWQLEPNAKPKGFTRGGRLGAAKKVGGEPSGEQIQKGTIARDVKKRGAVGILWPQRDKKTIKPPEIQHAATELGDPTQRS